MKLVRGKVDKFILNNMSYGSIHKIVKGISWNFVDENIVPRYVKKTCGGKFQSRITISNKLYNLGTFDTPEEAHKAALDFKENYNG